MVSATARWVFHLADSRSYRTFCRLGITDKLPSRSALNANFKALQAATLEAINRVVAGAAQQLSVETGRDRLPPLVPPSHQGRVLAGLVGRQRPDLVDSDIEDVAARQ